MSLSAPVVLAITLAAFAALHVIGSKLGQRLSPRGRLAAGIITALCCLPGAWFTLYYVHLLPEPPLLYQLRALSFSEGFLAIFGLAAGIWRVLLRKLLKPVPTAVTVFILVIPFLKPIIRPLDRSQLKETWIGDACIQSSMVTCGPASVASILRHLGDREIRESDLAIAGWTSQSGTEAWHLARAVEAMGYDATFSAPKGLPPSEDLPAMIGTGSQMVGHFVAVLEIKGNQITFIDPLRGKEQTSISHFTAWYPLEPFCMSIRKR